MATSGDESARPQGQKTLFSLGVFRQSEDPAKYDDLRIRCEARDAFELKEAQKSERTNLSLRQRRRKGQLLECETFGFGEPICQWGFLVGIRLRRWTALLYFVCTID